MTASVDQYCLTSHITVAFRHLHNAFGDVIGGAGMLLGRALLDAFHVFIITVALPVLLPFGTNKISFVPSRFKSAA